ncbi:MAG: glycosyl hydrolase family 28-related protein [Opitutaceae bacterium]
MSYQLGIRNRMAAVCWLLLLSLIIHNSAFCQQPSSTAALFAVNAQYVQGRTWADYKVSAGAGLTANVAAGLVWCKSALVTYAGGTLEMDDDTTNYIYLDTAAACAVDSNTTGITSTMIPIAQVVTADGAITSVTDTRSMLNASGASVVSSVVNVQDHGAVCDGSTDATTAIQAALDAIDTTRGGIVFFPAVGCTGAYKFGALTMPSNPHGYITFLSDADWTITHEIDWLNSDTAIIGRAGSTHVTWQLLPAMKLINGASLSRPIEIDPTGGGASPSAYYSGILLENIAFSGFADGVYLKRCHGTTIRNLNGSGANSTLHMVDMFVAHIEGGTYAGALDHPSIILEGIKNDSFTNIHIHDLTLIGSGIYTYSSVTSTPYNQWDTIHIHDILQESALGKYAAVWTVGDALYLQGTLLRNIQMADVITAGGTFTLTEVASVSGGETVYTGTITGGGSDALEGRIYKIAGFPTSANNGTFLCTGSSTTTLTLKNASGAAEVHAGTATITVPLIHLMGSAYLYNTELAGAYNGQGNAFFDSAGNNRGLGLSVTGYVTTASYSIGNPYYYHYRDQTGRYASNRDFWLGENAAAGIAEYYNPRLTLEPSTAQTGLRFKMPDTSYTDATRVQNASGQNLFAIGGDGILNGSKMKGSLQLAQLASPGTPTVTPTGGSATAWGYKITAYDILGNSTAASSEGTTAAGAATLSASAYNTLKWNVSPNCSYYKVNRTTAGGTPATTSNIAIVPCIRENPYHSQMTYVDDGDTILDANAPPATNTTGKGEFAGSITTESRTVPSKAAEVHLTGQSASISATTLYAVPSSGAGQYMVEVNLACSVADVSGAFVSATVHWTQNGIARSWTSGNFDIYLGLDSTDNVLPVFPVTIYADASTNIQYSTTVDGTPSTARYEFHAVAMKH